MHIYTYIHTHNTQYLDKQLGCIQVMLCLPVAVLDMVKVHHWGSPRRRGGRGGGGGEGEGEGEERGRGRGRRGGGGGGGGYSSMALRTFSFSSRCVAYLARREFTSSTLCFLASCTAKSHCRQ